MRRCVCLVTGDRNLAPVARTVADSVVFIELPKSPGRVAEEAIPHLALCLALRTGFTVSSGGEELMRVGPIDIARFDPAKPRLPLETPAHPGLATWISRVVDAQLRG